MVFGRLTPEQRELARELKQPQLNEAASIRDELIKSGILWCAHNNRSSRKDSS